MELTSAAKRLSRLKSTLGLTAASLIDKNYNQTDLHQEHDQGNKIKHYMTKQLGKNYFLEGHEGSFHMWDSH